jgi:hypothetical protein
VNTGQSASVRNLLIVLGLWTAAGILGGIVAFGTNYLPHYIASSSRPGSLILLFLIGSLPFLPFAGAAGFALSHLLASPQTRRWAVGLSALFVWQHLVSNSFGWRWLRMDLETQVGVPLEALLVGGACLAGFLFGRKRGRSESKAQPA